MKNFEQISVGTDIVEVSRVGKLARNKNFLKRVFTKGEVRYCAGKVNSAQHFAARFAAKEAVWKALSSMAGARGISHREIGVRRTDDGQPKVTFSTRLKHLEKKVSLSLSHTADFAIAVAVIVK